MFLDIWSRLTVPTLLKGGDHLFDSFAPFLFFIFAELLNGCYFSCVALCSLFLDWHKLLLLFCSDTTHCCCRVWQVLVPVPLSDNVDVWGWTSVYGHEFLLVIANLLNYRDRWVIYREGKSPLVEEITRLFSLKSFLWQFYLGNHDHRLGVERGLVRC